MIRLMKTRDGQAPVQLQEYPENWDMNDCSKVFTEHYKEELSDRDDTMYVASLEEELATLNEEAEFYDYDNEQIIVDEDIVRENEAYIKNIDWRGAGYYTVDGDCLLLDNELKTYIHEDVYTWELVEAPNDIIISGSDLFNTITGFLSAEYLVIRRDGSLCLMGQNERFADDGIELFRVILCSNLEEHNSFVAENTEDNGYCNDNFFETIKDKILDDVMQYNRENGSKININIW